MSLRLLRYLWYSTTHPQRRDFVEAGIGIEARYARSKSYWQPHLDLCRKFQLANSVPLKGSSLKAGESTPSSISILGAGRLLDVPLEKYRHYFQSISLVDADPICLPLWDREIKKTKAKSQIRSVITDVTGTLDTWTKKASSFLSEKPSRNAIVEFLETLEVEQPPVFRAEVVVSLNLLSQIPIFWRDRLHALLKKYVKIDTDEDGLLEKFLEDAVRSTRQKLEEQHLNLLAVNAAKKIILITDQYLLYYRQDLSMFREVPALVSTFPLKINGFTIAASDGWFWHIAPQKIEFQDFGVIHQVQALSYERDG